MSDHIEIQSGGYRLFYRCEKVTYYDSSRRQIMNINRAGSNMTVTSFDLILHITSPLCYLEDHTKKLNVARLFKNTALRSTRVQKLNLGIISPNYRFKTRHAQ